LFAAVDCGTNSIRLLLTRLVDGRLVDVERRLQITRLGKGVDATGRLDPDSLSATFAVFAEYAQLIQDAKVRIVATSAVRDASNKDEFFAGARSAFGVDAEVISGEEEARLSYLGAITGLPGLAEPLLVMDIGGGSTELVTQDGGISLNMGSVRVRERYLASDPPTIAEIEAAEEFINSLLDTSGVDFAAATWVGVGGTATCLSAIAQQLPAYDAEIVHGSVVSQDVLDDLTQDLLRMTIAEIAAIPTMVPGREDVITAGALVCREIGLRTNLPLIVSETDILDGVVNRLAFE
jgi:exopolyphosphatase/guanosine-5'-triphosphate,3'-diphosphate pyrophosphatase